MRRRFAVLMAAAVPACGSDSTAPPRFPAVSGTYQIDLTFEGIPSALGSGTITIVQASRNERRLTGSSSVTVTDGPRLGVRSLSTTVRRTG